MKKILMTLTLALAAAIAIPAAAQSTANAKEQTAECCKDKKECAKDSKKECSKEGKKECAKAKEGQACCKQGAGKKVMHRAQKGKMMKADRRVDAPKVKAMRHSQRLNPMMKGITLTEEQKQKMNALREKNISAEKKAKSDAKVKSQEEIQKLRAEFDKEMEKILDKDQLKQYQANKAEMEAKRADRQTKLPKTEKKTK